MSAQPPIPKPILLIFLTVSQICGKGYGLTSITSSKNLTDCQTASFNPSQSTPLPSFPSLTKYLKKILPKLHASKPYSGCSPHGLVLSTGPKLGTGLALLALTRSINTIPGSPDLQAESQIKSKISLARSLPTTSFVCGATNSYSPSSSKAFIKSSVASTEILKFVIPPSSLHVINSLISGWSTLSIPILAPLLVPPCLTC